MSDELNQPPVALSDPDIDTGDFEKLTALLDDSGNLPDHSDRAVQDEKEAPETEPAKEPQPEKRIESKPEGEQPKPQETEQAETAEVEMDGKKYTVPAELKDAVLRFADYTRKTQEVAAERHAVQQERAAAYAFAQEAQQMVGHYAALQQIEAQLQQAPQEYNQALQAGDQLRALHIRQAAFELAQTRQGMIGQLEQARNARLSAQAQEFARSASEGHKALAAEIKDWGPEKQKTLADLAQSFGFRAEELATVTDPRSVRLLNELHSLREENASLKGSQDVAQKQVRQAPPKPVRSSSVQQPGDEQPSASKEIARLRKTGSDDDALAALRALGIG